LTLTLTLPLTLTPTLTLTLSLCAPFSTMGGVSQRVMCIGDSWLMAVSRSHSAGSPAGSATFSVTVPAFDRHATETRAEL
jgi:hypothetical protein